VGLPSIARSPRHRKATFAQAAWDDMLCQMQTLETSRLRLSPFVESDANFILELLNEPAFLRDIGDKKVRSLADARAYIANGPLTSYRDHGFGLLRVELKDTAKPIGMCGLLKREFLEHPDLGYALLERYWTNGFAIEAASATMHYAANGLGQRAVLAMTALQNPTSIRLLEKLGFRFERIASFPGYDEASRVFIWKRESDEVMR
jgi:[ribosomal protein S5]-alanine N-acetyltransferase